MRSVPIPSHPVVSLEEARVLEAGLFGGEESREWRAMGQAGVAVACAIIRDFSETGPIPAQMRLLVLAGKGNNAGDALIAARALLERYPAASADVLFAFGTRQLRPLAARAWRGLSESARGRVRSVAVGGVSRAYDIAIDGIFGFQFRPPLPPEALAAVAASEACAVRFRASVDLPSGLDEAGAFRADFTYATGSVKAPLLGCANAGRPRYLDLGFFEAGGDAEAHDRVILASILDPLGGLRPAGSDKRSQGHLALMGGSSHLPGAILMATMAALHSGAGLVTVFVPERLADIYAARAPDAMWVGLPVTASGGLSPSGLRAFLKGAERATALAIGPGLGRDPKSFALVKSILRAIEVPVLIDADALQADVVRTGKTQRILTPHAGELKRIAKGQNLRALCRSIPAVIIAKGPVTRVCKAGPIFHNFFGGPVLARGGSGDVLAGLGGGLLAQTPGDPLEAACRAAAWHGMAADHLARAHGQTAVRTVQLLDHLAPVLRG